MSSATRIDELLDGVRAGLAAGRPGHAYLVVGAARGAGRVLAEGLVAMVFCGAERKPCGECDGCRRVRARTHPDAGWIEPESKSRRIQIEEIREKLLPRIGQTSYAGGWKAAVLLQADRLTEAAANAFLKTLEEPPPRTLLVLVSDRPQDLLPTVLSRCRRLALADEPPALDREWRERLLGVLATGRGRGPVERSGRAQAISAILVDLRARVAKEQAPADGAEGDDETGGADGADEARTKEVAEARINARVIETRRELLRLISDWQRDVLLLAVGAGEGTLCFPEHAADLRAQAAGLGYADALRRVAAVEDMARQLERNVSPETALEGFFRR